MMVAAAQPFLPGSRLYAPEIGLIEAVERGESYEPDLDLEECIRGELIRALLVGTPLRYHPAKTSGLGKPLAVRVTAHGIRVASPKRRTPAEDAATALPLLRIAGTLDLTGLAAPQGGFLPPLDLSHCTFEKAALLDGTQLQSLTLTCCRLPRLVARCAKIDGCVTLSGCRPPCDPADAEERFFASHDLAAGRGGGYSYEPVEWGALGTEDDCPCCDCSPSNLRTDVPCRRSFLLDFSSAVIHGSLTIERCYLRAPGIVGRSYRLPTLRDNLVADLRHIRVEGSVHIVTTTAIGFIGMPSAHIADDLWISGGKFFAAVDRPTFDFQSMSVGGLLVFQAHPTGASADSGPLRARPVVVIGHVSAIGLTAAEVWLGEGLFYGNDPDGLGAFPTLYFAKCDIRRTFKLGAYHDYHIEDPQHPTGGAMVQGEICLLAANVGKNLEVHGADSRGMAAILELQRPFFRALGARDDAEPYLSLFGEGLKVDRRVQISHAHFQRGSAPDTKNDGDGVEVEPGQSKTRRAVIDLFKSTVGTGLRLTDSCSCAGPVRLNSCVIGREAIINCHTIGDPDDQPWTTPEGDTVIPWLLDMRESSIKGHLKIGRKEGPPEDEDAVTIFGGITLESAKIQGSIIIRRVRLNLCRFTIDRARSGAPRPLEDRHRIALNLRDCECDSELEIHSLRWSLPELNPEEVDRLSAPRGFWPRRWRGDGAPEYYDIRDSSYAVIDLRGLRCGLLADGFAIGWGLIYRLRLRLAGIRIDHVESGSGHDGFNRIRWLTAQNVRQRVSSVCETPRNPALTSVTLLERHHCSSEQDFVPQAYDAFSAANRQAGEDRTAEQIQIEKKNVQSALRFHRLVDLWKRRAWPPRTLLLGFLLAVSLWTLLFATGLSPALSTAVILGVLAGILLAWPLFSAFFQLIFRYGFRYGLSPDMALFVFVVCISIGWLGVHWARNGGFDTVEDWSAVTRNGPLPKSVKLVLEVPYMPQPGFAAGKDGGIRGASTRSETRALYATPSPCNLDVSSLLYAMDVFIPVIDLDQEKRCSIRDPDRLDKGDPYFAWRLAKALYKLLGWLVTSLVILTITGLLRRDLEPR